MYLLLSWAFTVGFLQMLQCFDDVRLCTVRHGASLMLEEAASKMYMLLTSANL